MSEITFGVDLIPQSNNNYTLGNENKKWNLYVNSINGETYDPNDKRITVQVEQSSNTPTAEFIVSTNDSTSSELTGVLGSTATLTNGKIIYYMTRYPLPSSEVTIKLRYGSSSNYTNSIPIYFFGGNRSVTPYPASCVLTLIYYDNKFYIAGPNLAVIY